MKNHYFKTKLIKMGQWAMLPGDVETWHGEHTNAYFKKLFGINKGLLLLNDLKESYSHVYAPEQYLQRLFARVDAINKKNYKSLEKKLKTFYSLLPKAKLAVSKQNYHIRRLTNQQLAAKFYSIRDWIHHLAIYDQFGWLAEEYWTLKMRDILKNKLHLKPGSEDYNEALFALTKPENKSTTLLEKQAVLTQLIKIKTRQTSLAQAAKKLANDFGWLPVFVFGEPWKAKHYQDELKPLLNEPLSNLRGEFLQLKNYTKIRNAAIHRLINKYDIDKKDFQIFIDFSLAIDTRNEAEYFVSYGGFYLMPLFKEIARRLYLSLRQVRYLHEKEMLNALTGIVDAQKILSQRTLWGSWGFDQAIKKRITIDQQTSKKLFTYVERYVKPVQGRDETKGTCASSGKAIGKIRIVPYPTDNHKVKLGDIMITYSTTTDYLPAMKRASAIITEVGGLTCHAAVVSREFGIPCIVALTNAMKNFKDGEMVEVDANRGTVKRIKV